MIEGCLRRISTKLKFIPCTNLKAEKKIEKGITLQLKIYVLMIFGVQNKIISRTKLGGTLG